MLWKTKNRKGAYMEVVDKLNKRKEPLNKKSDRYERIDGEYCQYVHVCIMNDKNEFLLQKRSPSKKIYPNMWSQTGGAVDSGETSLQGALREVKEELGIDLNKENMEFMLSFKRFNSFVDVWLAKQNIDLKDEIYAILRYNDHFCATQGISTINVSFIPKEDVHHIYFRLNKKNHRGISDLSKAITPAMLYCLLYLSDIIARIGRGQDKRIYYVRQNVETNVAKTLLNVINQIKKGNMGMRQLENMNSIFNIIGKFNDHVIPMSQNGDPPIQFEVMQGQQVETPTDLLDRLEDMAVGTTDVPLEFVQTVNQVDYATRFTMSNSKFLRKVFKRQSIFQKHLTNIFRKLYNFEYRENEMTIKVMLPAPAYLTLTNTQQLIDNNRNYVQGIADIVMSTEDDEEKAEFINLMIRKQLGTYIDFEMVDSLVEEAKHVVEIKKLERQEVEDDTGGDYGGGNDYGGDDDEY